MGRKKGLEFDESPPDDFDPSNPYKDPVAMLEMREHLASTTSRSVDTSSNNISTPLVASAGARTVATPPSTVQRWLSRLSLTDSRLKLFRELNLDGS
ncbi:hypothetical protein CMV_006682 [Castanea mollissima]|uniref:Uncharacterized protein n=1 Tax=Castanea mollissima TaxID=60419 RepID=A0A8J4RMX1_9ROSI|nr:hypothetical protein CMV_006682 [Castanea mollissima]